MAITTLNLRGLNRSDTATSGQLVTATSATAMDFQDAAGGAWNFIRTETPSDAASVVFVHGTSGVDFTTYPIYKLVGYDISVATDDTWQTIRLSDDTGSSYETANYDSIHDFGAAGYSNSEIRSTAAYALFMNAVGNATNEGCAFEFTLVNPASNTEYCRYWWQGMMHNSSGGMVQTSGSGAYEVTDNIDAIQVLQSSGNITGTYKLYGLSGS